MSLLRLPTLLRVPSLSPRLLSTAAAAAPTPSTSTLPTRPPQPEPRPVLLPYAIRRTPSGFLPVYGDVKSGGQRFTTIVRKIDGDVEALRRDLEQAIPSSSAYSKPASRQVILRGDWVKETKEWLGEKGF